MFWSFGCRSETLAATPGSGEKRGAVDEMGTEKIARLAHSVITGDHHDGLVEWLGGQP